MMRPETSADLRAGSSSPTARRSLARFITELLAPAPMASALLLIVALHSAASPAAALRWALVAILFGCALPFLYIIRGVRRRRLSDHHVRVRQQRPLPIVVALCSVLIGLALLFILGAPRQLLIVVAAMAVGLVVSLVITLVWKISVHTGTVAGSIVILALIFGPAVLIFELLAALVGWARVELGDHTLAQVVGGGMIGAATAAVVFLLLR
jgi:membrane-associated phospholipid phosphatase